MNGAASPLVMAHVPSPLENATGIVCHPGVWRTSAISVRPLPLKSPVTTRTPGPLAHSSPPMNGAASPLVMAHVPSPLENATGIVCHPGVWRTSAISVRPLPLKSPATTRTPGPLAHSAPPMNGAASPLVMAHVPSPLENATGIVCHPGVWRTSAISVRPLPLKSPATTRTPGPLAHSSPPMNGAASPLVMAHVPSPLENATGIVCHPGVWRTSAISPPCTA